MIAHQYWVRTFLKVTEGLQWLKLVFNLWVNMFDSNYEEKNNTIVVFGMYIQFFGQIGLL